MTKSNILIFSTNGFSRVNSNKTYEAIFRQFEKENLYSFFLRPYDYMIDYEYCNSYYAVSESDIIRKFVNPKSQCGGIVKPQNLSNNFQTDKTKSIYQKFKILPLKNIPILKDILWLTNLWFNSSFKKWLKFSEIDLIFFHDPGLISTQIMARKLLRLLDVPLVIYVTDDYFVYNKKNLLHSIYQFFLRKDFKKLLQFSSERYCIGDEMARCYLENFGYKFKVIMNCAVIKPIQINYPKRIPIVSYFGGLHLNRWKMIARFADLVRGRMEIRVYTSSSISETIKKIFKNYNVNICGCVFGEDLEREILESDILLHVESDSKKNIQRTMLTVSTKIPEYMTSGKLIVGYGPGLIASMKFIKDNNIGYSINSNSNNISCIDEIMNIINDKEMMTYYIMNAYNYAKKHFEINQVSLNFKTNMFHIIQNYQTSRTVKML